MRGTQRDDKRWALVAELLRLNPNVPYARIGREVGYQGQTVGLIAKAHGLPPRGAGGFQKKDETPLIYPPEMKTAQEEPEKVEADAT